MTTTEETTPHLHFEPQPQHHWLQQLVGKWTYEMDVAEPGQPPKKLTGSERVRSLGPLWVVAEGEGEMPDGHPATSIMTLGFDPGTGRHVGTFVSSVMPQLWVYDGELDAEGRVLTLQAQGPSMAGDGTLATYHDIIEIVDDGRRVMTSKVQQGDGTWLQFMRMEFRRPA